MRLAEFDDLLTTLIGEADHPEIRSVEPCRTDDTAPTYHSRVRVRFHSGATATIMVRAVEGRLDGKAVPSHPPFQLPEVIA